MDGKEDKLTVILKEEYRGQRDILSQARLLVQFLEDCGKIRMFNLDKNHIGGARLPDLSQMKKTAEILNLDIDKFSIELEREKMRLFIQEALDKFDARLSHIYDMIEENDADAKAIFDYVQAELRSLDEVLASQMPESEVESLKSELDSVKKACFRYNPKLRDYNVTH